MIHQAQVTFHLVKPLIFLRSTDSKQVVKGEPIKFFLLPDRDKLIFFTQNNVPISRLYLSPYDLNRSQNGQELTINFNQQTQGSSRENRQYKSTPIAHIKSTKICIDQILSLSNNRRKYKSCLSFAPSSVHMISILSGESPTQKFRGFMNLIAIMFVILNLRNMIDNFYKYGALFTNAPFQFTPIAAILGLLSLGIFIQFAFYIERLRFNRALKTDKAGLLLKINQITLLIYLALYCRRFLDNHPLSAIGFTALGVVFFLKLISYMQVNTELLQIMQKTSHIPEAEFTQFVFANHQISKQNLALLQSYKFSWEQLICHSHLYYFLAAPTLCYQLSYPRTSSIRIPWVIKRLAQFFIISALQLVLWVQYIEPELKVWNQVMEEGRYTYLQVFNRIIRLSVPNTVAWIMGFYNFFHVFLNIMAEVLKFADRHFYMDWWNCRNLQEYWKTWNLPVHFWFIRHCYNPLLSRGISRMQANIIVFLLSAIGHQYIVCVPLGLISYYAFLAMLMQAPAIIFQKKMNHILNIKNSELGNLSFWLFFCVLGQPLCVFIYYSLYMRKLTLEGKI